MRYNRNTNLTGDILSRLTKIAASKQEHLVCFTLDGAFRVIKQHVVFKGTLSGVEAHPREIFFTGITDSAAKIVIAHNHPYGEPEPSPADIEATQRLMSCGRILGIPLVDHIVVAGTKHFSLAEHGYMSEYTGELLMEYLK